MLNDLEAIKNEGFEGFLSIRRLRMTGLREVPDQMGVYLVLRVAPEAHEFLERSPAGHFKGQDPTVAIEKLHAHWIDGAIVLNIGKAGAPGGSATLYSRLKQYLEFGAGKPVGHRGGRLIWQLKDAQDLLVAWKVIESGIPREVEREYIRLFKDANEGRRPFANLQD
jgi:hypothetical protein